MKKTPIWFSASSFTLNLKISSWQPFYTILTINKCGKCIELALGFLFVCTKSILTLNRKKTHSAKDGLADRQSQRLFRPKSP